jgi:hypothetical protein
MCTKVDLGNPRSDRLLAICFCYPEEIKGRTQDGIGQVDILPAILLPVEIDEFIEVSLVRKPEEVHALGVEIKLVGLRCFQRGPKDVVKMEESEKVAFIRNKDQNLLGRRRGP